MHEMLIKTLLYYFFKASKLTMRKEQLLNTVDGKIFLDNTGQLMEKNILIICKE